MQLFYRRSGWGNFRWPPGLTVIATIFIPLTFIAGVYGMNFEHMPELCWRWGYALVWGVMLAVGAGMLVYFRRKRWF